MIDDDINIVIHHYQSSVENGDLPALKQALNTLMTTNFIGDIELARTYSHILEAIDLGNIKELPQAELALFDKFLAPSPHTGH